MNEFWLQVLDYAISFITASLAGVTGAYLVLRFIPFRINNNWYGKLTNKLEEVPNIVDIGCYDEAQKHLFAVICNQILEIEKEFHLEFGKSYLQEIHDWNDQIDNKGDVLLTFDLRDFLGNKHNEKDERSFLSERILCNYLLIKDDEIAYRFHIFRGEHWDNKVPGFFRFSLNYWYNHRRRYINRLKAIQMKQKENTIEPSVTSSAAIPPISNQTLNVSKKKQNDYKENIYLVDNDQSLIHHSSSKISISRTSKRKRTSHAAADVDNNNNNNNSIKDTRPRKRNQRKLIT